MSEHPSVDPEQLKAGMRDAWNHAAPGWNEQTPQIHRWLANATQTMFDLAQVGQGHRVLDVAAGAGDQTIYAAQRVGPAGHVLATDISPKIIGLARENARKAGLDNVEARVADAEAIDVPASSFDAAICRLGLMFCPDPLKALRAMHHALKPGAHACVMVFSQPEHNPCVGILLQTAFKHAGLPPANPYQPGGLFSLSRPGHIGELFAKAGYLGTSTMAVPATFHLPTASAYLDFIRSSASPIIRILSGLDEQSRAAAWKDMAARLEAFQTPEGWDGPNELLLTVGRKS